MNTQTLTLFIVWFVLAPLAGLLAWLAGRRLAIWKRVALAAGWVALLAVALLPVLMYADERGGLVRTLVWIEVAVLVTETVIFIIAWVPDDSPLRRTPRAGQPAPTPAAPAAPARPGRTSFATQVPLAEDEW